MTLPRGSNNQVQGAANVKTRLPWRTAPLSADGSLYSDGSSIYLAPIDDGQLLGNISGGSETPEGVSFSDFLDYNISNVQGTILFRNATSWTNLAPGTSGYVLTTNGAGADVTWAAGGGGGLTPANPTATAGPTAVNGTATTYMRSDAAPAVQLGSSSQKGLVQVDGTTIVASGGVISATATSPTGANPTATASDIAVNGTATTFMRSDAAPAVQLGSSSQFGLVKVDGSTIVASGGTISTTSLPASAQIHPGYRSGMYYGLQGFGTASTMSVSANTLYAIPFYCAISTTFTQFVFRTNTTGSGNFEAGIYSNSSGVPNALLQDLGSHTVVSSAVNSLTGLTLAFTPGWYWLALAFSASGNIVFAMNLSNTPSNWIYGVTAPNATATGITASWTYSAGALPSTFPTIVNTGSAVPNIMLGL